MRIACDMDGVVCKWSEHFLSWLNCLYNKAIQLEDITDWDWWNVVDITKEEFDNAFVEFTRHGMWSTIPMYEDATNVLCALTSLGHHIYYFTDRPEESRRNTLKYITGNGLTIDSVIFCRGKEKAKIAKELNIDIAIDDKFSTIQDYHDIGIGAILRRQPYNEKFDWDMDCRSLRRFKMIVEERSNAITEK